MWRATQRSLWSARPLLLRRGAGAVWSTFLWFPTWHLQASLLAGLAAKAGKASSAAEAKPMNEAVNSIAQPSDRPANEYPSWLGNLTQPGRTLGELKRIPVEQRSTDDVGLPQLPATNRMTDSSCSAKC